MTRTIAFIGGGNMATSLIGGLIAAGHAAQQLYVADIDGRRLASLHERFGVQTLEPGSDALQEAEILVLAVKPQVLREVACELRPAAGATVLSIAAGIRIDSLRRWLGSGVQLVRSMPNTPALYRAGVSGLFAPPATTPQARAQAEYVLSAVGQCHWVGEETLLDAVTAVSGSGPAYVFQLCEMMRDAGTALGLDRELAAALAAGTISGAARMLLEAGEDAETLRRKVTSKGGTTAAALELLENRGVRSIYNAALAAAARRAAELGDELDRS